MSGLAAIAVRRSGTHASVPRNVSTIGWIDRTPTPFSSFSATKYLFSRT